MYSKAQVKIHRNKFTELEDKLLKIIILQVGDKNWNEVSRKMTGRTPRQCRDRWNHYLSPLANTTKWTREEDEILLHNFQTFGTHWEKYKSLFNGRTSNSIRNRYYVLRKKDIFFNEDIQESKMKEKRVILPPISTILLQEWEMQTIIASN